MSSLIVNPAVNKLTLLGAAGPTGATGATGPAGAGTTKEYVQSRTAQLITNGSGLLGDNTNFSGFTFDGANTVVGAGGFSLYAATTKSAAIDEFIPVDPNKKYVVEVWVKGSGSVQGYLAFECFDIDERTIAAYYYMQTASTQTTLAADLTPGDTTIELTDSANWLDNGAATYQRGIILYPYENDYGYEYPDYEYSRHAVNTALWADSGSPINRTTHIITLNTTFPSSIGNPNHGSGTWPAGTPVANKTSGNTYQYPFIGATGLITWPTSWTKYTAIFGGTIATPTASSASKTFPPGTALVKFRILSGYTAAGTVYISGLSMMEHPTVLTSPDGTLWEVEVDNAGALSTSASATT